MDDYLALSLIIMGIAIGALLVIWGAMSLAFFLRKKHRAKKLQAVSYTHLTLPTSDLV